MKISFEHHVFAHDNGTAEKLDRIIQLQERILMDTTAIKAGFGQLSTDFGTFATDLKAYLAKTVPQDTPQQVADLQAVTTGLGDLDTTVKSLDAIINPPAAQVPVVS